MRASPTPAPAVSAEPAPRERRTLVLAPTANDARLAAGFLDRAQLPTVVCRDVDQLCARLAEGCGTVLLAEEVLHPEAAEAIRATLRRQPSWSDIPITLVCSSGERSELNLRHLRILGPGVSVSLIERPFRPETLISMTEAALRLRARQYQVRDLLHAIAANEARVRRIFEQAVVGIAETDLSGRFTLVNQRYCEIVGRSRAALLELALPELTHPDEREGARRRIASLAAGQDSSYIIEKRLLRPGGAIVWVHDHVSTIRDSSGRLQGLTVATADITERKHAEEQLARARDEAVAASRAKDDFLASLSHELRTPLNPVLLLASEGAQNPQLPPAVQADFETIARNVALEARLIDDLLDLTRITRGKLQLDRQVHSVHVILEDAIATVMPDVDDKQIVLKRDFTTQPPAIHGDAVRLQQVFWNVLKNAVKFTPAGGTVTVATRLDPDASRVLVSVCDTGIGMTEEEIGRVFDAFVQGDHAGCRTHHFGGLGLGLAISKRLVDLHAGHISAHSEGTGCGARFVISLPLAPVVHPAATAPVADRGQARPPVPNAKPRRLLLVDDHEATRQALAFLLQRRNFEVVAAGTVAEALAIADRGGFDLIVSDIGLPDGTGYDLMERVSAGTGIKGIALTGYGMDQDMALSERAGFAAHLTKPVRIEALDEALKKVLAGA